MKEYDYSQAGAYFVTICTHNSEIFLVREDVKDMIFTFWHKLPEKFDNISIDAFIIMPNHVHGIIFLNEPDPDDSSVGIDTKTQNNNNTVGADPCVCPDIPKTVNAQKMGEHMGSPLRTIGHIVQWFKTMTTNNYIRGVKNNGWEPFEKRFWQRNYYEHIIRNEKELNQTHQYIIDNPLNWESDEENPQNWRGV